MNNNQFTVVIVLLSLWIGICIGIIYSISVDSNYDYKINLDYNKIEVLKIDDEDTYIIHPDSLEEFIATDNL
jgi:hypothetical protein